MASGKTSADYRLITSKQIEQELVDLTASIDRLLNDLQPAIRGEGNGG
jgi:hypothetical protein